MRQFQRIRALGRSQSGAALALALVTLALVTVLGITLITLGMTEVNISTNWRAYSDALYAADAGIESGVVVVRNFLATYPNVSDQLANLNTIQAPPTFNSTALKNVAFFTSPNSIYTIAPANNPPSYPTTFNTGPFSGLSGIATDYLITSQATGAGGTSSRLAQTVQFVQVPLFQFNVFYGKGVDLEIEPTPAMTLNGKVFANSNLYVGADNSLTVQGIMKAAGKIYRTKKEAVTSFSPTLNPITGTYDPSSYTFGNLSPVNPQIADASGKLQTLNFDSIYQPGGATKWATPDSTAWANQTQSTFGGTVADGAMGVGQITPPIPALLSNPNASNPDVLAHQLIEMPQASDSAALKAAKLYSQADIRIIDGVATDKNGTVLPLPGSVYTPTSFYDGREQKTVIVMQIDIAKLQQVAAGKDLPANGILYVGSTASPTSTTMPAVRLVNGATLPPKGLTVVSQNPIYIAGDYNTLQPAQCGPNCGSGTHPPAAVIGDAVTVLSNSWCPSGNCSAYDAKGNQAKSSRPGSTTTVNAAIMTGPSAESTTNGSNGQLENDIRFLEDWSGGKTLNYSGSIVSLWHSMQATALYGLTDVYSPPVRNWRYDTLFNTNPPPGTPQGVIITRGQWTQG